MKKTNPKKLEEFIRVDHAGERGAIKIYEGQLLALNTIVNDEDLKKTINEMKKHEEEHCDFFENEINKRNINPTKFLPLWDLLGLGLGFGSTILGKKAAMLCTASVEEVIDEHYKNQINQLENDERVNYMEMIGLKKTGLNMLIQKGYKILELDTYFTSGPEETRAWTIQKNCTAPKAAGEIHTDFEKGFIRAETISYDDFIANEGWVKSKTNGKMRLEGKDYIVKDGDVLNFRFNT